MTSPLITVAVPSLNQGRFLEEALGSISQQGLDIEIFVLDAGSQDNSLEVIEKWNNQLAGWRSHPDAGQAAAINEGISKGTAKYVCWLNSDDFFMPHGLEKLVHALEQNATAPAAYGKCWTVSKSSRKIIPYLTLPFNRLLLAQFCFIAQPATLIRRTAWEHVNGLNEAMHLAFDYDLWWKLLNSLGNPVYVKEYVAATRAHPDTKTANNLNLHYEESIGIVRHYHGNVPLKWKIAKPLIGLIRKGKGKYRKT